MNSNNPLHRELFTGLESVVKEQLRLMMSDVSQVDILDMDWMQAFMRECCLWLAQLVCASWVLSVETIAKKMALICPKCGKPRKCKTRPHDKMSVRLLGCDFEVPKLYFECGHAGCDAPGISITKVLTGLRNGSVSAELELAAAYAASQHSYADASQELEVHHGQRIERTTVRRMALHVEAEAKAFLQQQRDEATSALTYRKHGVRSLILQADGGSVRTGKLVTLRQDDAQDRETLPQTQDVKPRNCHH